MQTVARRKARRFTERLISANGKINIVTILLIVVVAAAVYMAVMLVPPYIEYYKLDEKVRAIANEAHRNKNDESLMKNLRKETEALGLNLPYEAISLQRDPLGKWIEINVTYARVVELRPFGKELTLHFDINCVERL